MNYEDWLKAHPRRDVDYSKPFPRDLVAAKKETSRNFGRATHHMQRAEQALDAGRLYGPYIERDYTEYHIRMAVDNLTATGPLWNHEKTREWRRLSRICARMAKLTQERNKIETTLTDTKWNEVTT